MTGRVRRVLRWMGEVAGCTPREAAYAEDLDRHKEQSRAVMSDMAAQVSAIEEAAAMNQALAEKSERAAHQMLRRLKEDLPHDVD